MPKKTAVFAKCYEIEYGTTMAKPPSEIAASYLGFNRREWRVFQALPTRVPLDLSKISEQAGVPRTTAQSAIKRLYERRLARRFTSRGGRTLWRRPSQSALKRLIDQSSHLLLPEKKTGLRPLRKKKIFETPSVHVEVIRGGHEIVKVYMEAFAGRPGERTFLTQVSDSFKLNQNRISSAEMSQTNQIAIKHEGILEIVMSKSTKNHYIELVKKNPYWIEGAKGRLVDIAVMPDDFFINLHHELFIFRDYVMTTDWESETAILTKNQQLAELLLTGFRTARTLGETFNTFDFLEMLEKISHQQRDAS